MEFYIDQLKIITRSDDLIGHRLTNVRLFYTFEKVTFGKISNVFNKIECSSMEKRLTHLWQFEWMKLHTKVPTTIELYCIFSLRWMLYYFRLKSSNGWLDYESISFYCRTNILVYFSFHLKIPKYYFDSSERDFIRTNQNLISFVFIYLLRSTFCFWNVRYQAFIFTNVYISLLW